jgi:hypothetical protein
MTALERRLFSLLVGKYIRREIARGCSDFNAVEEAGLTLDECEDLHQRMAVWNGAPEDKQSGPWFQDWYLAGFLQHLFDQETVRMS